MYKVYVNVTIQEFEALKAYISNCYQLEFKEGDVFAAYYAPGSTSINMRKIHAIEETIHSFIWGYRAGKKK